MKCPVYYTVSLLAYSVQNFIQLCVRCVEITVKINDSVLDLASTLRVSEF
jgi:hypothetical protein